MRLCSGCPEIVIMVDNSCSYQLCQKLLYCSLDESLTDKESRLVNAILPGRVCLLLLRLFLKNSSFDWLSMDLQTLTRDCSTSRTGISSSTGPCSSP